MPRKKPLSRQARADHVDRTLEGLYPETPDHHALLRRQADKPPPQADKRR